MTQSMTAFVRLQQSITEGLLCWEIRSLNHRFLEASFYLPDELRALESNLRTMLRDRLNRGKVDCRLNLQIENEKAEQIAINKPLIQNLLTTANTIAASFDLQNDLSLRFILDWPKVLQTQCAEPELISQQATDLFAKALAKLVKLRKFEGEALRKQMLLRLDKLRAEIKKANIFAIKSMEQTRVKLLERLTNLNLGTIENGRTEQELALWLNKMDVSEELDRLTIHLTEIYNILEYQEPIGSRLNFFLQELNREANTLSAKSNHIPLTNCAIEMKVLIEQLREQAQNIE